MAIKLRRGWWGENGGKTLFWALGSEVLTGEGGTTELGIAHKKSPRRRDERGLLKYEIGLVISKLGTIILNDKNNIYIALSIVAR
jgi:hypothetical protein